jgi:septal ring factor EnvC (AmiA/AmiB activator)
MNPPQPVVVSDAKRGVGETVTALLPMTLLLSRFLLAMLACLSLLGTAISATDKPSEREAALTLLRNKIEGLRKEITATQTLHDSVRSELATLERQISEVHKQIRKLAREQGKQQHKLLALRADEKKAQQQLAQQQDLLARQIRAAYMVGDQEYLKLLLNQEDPAALSRTNKYYEYLHRARAERIHLTQQTVQQLAMIEAQIHTETTTLQTLQATQEAKKQELVARSHSRAAVVAQLRTALVSKEQELAQSLEDEKRLQRVLTTIREALPDLLAAPGQRKAFAHLKGHLHWPTSGRIQDIFGKPRDSGKTKSNGVLIHAEEGRDIRAVSYGRVAYADWLRGYGLLLILDHGDGYMSLYGHNQSLHKETGEWVETGEVIASVGKSGGEDNPSLYFEIRHNGKPANPSQWCRR